jgi:hypothetical protein
MSPLRPLSRVELGMLSGASAQTNKLINGLVNLIQLARGGERQPERLCAGAFDDLRR